MDIESLHQLFQAQRHRKRLYAQFVHAGALVFDVGANVGEHTRTFLELGARVIAVEPQQECVRELNAVYTQDSRVTIVPQALGAAPGELEIQLNRRNRWSSLNPDFVRAVSPEPVYQKSEWLGKRTVHVTTLDALVEEFGLPAFVKIDVEGFEAQVMQGLSRPISAACFEFQVHYLAAALAGIEHLEQLGTGQYNYIVLDENQLKLDAWVTADEMQHILKRHEHSRAFFKGDVFVQMHPDLQ